MCLARSQSERSVRMLGELLLGMDKPGARIILHGPPAQRDDDDDTDVTFITQQKQQAVWFVEN